MKFFKRTSFEPSAWASFIPVLFLIVTLVVIIIRYGADAVSSMSQMILLSSVPLHQNRVAQKCLADTPRAPHFVAHRHDVGYMDARRYRPFAHLLRTLIPGAGHIPHAHLRCV